jgi:hypothetical protein
VRLTRLLGITCAQFRTLVKKEHWTESMLVAERHGQLDEPTKTIRCILTSNPADTVNPYACLIALYLKATAKPAEGTPTGIGFCANGCGQRVLGRQKFASDACRKRATRRVA